MSKVKATFVCPTYNCAGYLAETIRSVQDQTVPDWEMVIVDDGSTDTTEMLMDSLCADDKRLRYIRHDENKGVVHARNTGNDAAESDLILVIDHDDLCSADRLDVTLRHFKKYPDTDIFHGAWYEITTRRIPMTDRQLPIKITKDRLSPFCHSTCAYPKKIAKKHPYHLYERKLGDLIMHKTDDLCALEDWTDAGLVFRTTKKILCAVRRLPTGQMQQIRANKGLPPSWSE